MLKALDHLVMAIDRDRLDDIRQQLYAAGFWPGGDPGEHETTKTADENFVYADGAYLELVWELSDASGPSVWFERIPRLQGVGFSSDDYAADIAPWKDEDGAWDVRYAKVLEDGSRFEVRGGGPIAMFDNEFYIFVMDRELPRFPLGAEPRLRRLTFAGTDAELWRERLARWTPMPESDGGGYVFDGTEFRFEPDSFPGSWVSLLYTVPGEGATIPLAHGELVLLQESEWSESA
jgi:hypothetical protein